MFLLGPILFAMVGLTPIDRMSIDRNTLVNTTVVLRVLNHIFLPHGALIPTFGIVHQLGEPHHLLTHLISGPREKMFLRRLPQAPEVGIQETTHQTGCSNHQIHGNKHTMIALRDSTSKLPSCCLPLCFLWPFSSPPSDRFSGRRRRVSLDGPPDKPRSDRTPPFIPGGDRYRPAANKRESFPPPRSDSYRPQYENGWNPPFRREAISPVNNSHHRRESGSFMVSRISDRHGSPYANRPLVGKSAPSPHTVTPVRTPNWMIPDTDSDPWFSTGPTKRDVLPRAPSRSSIASTHVSDRESPVFNVTPLPLPSSPSTLANQPQQTVVQRKLEIRSSQLSSQPVLENKLDAPKTSEPKRTANGTPVRLAPEIPTESTPEPKLVPPVKQQTPDVSISAIEISHSPKQNPSIPSTI